MGAVDSRAVVYSVDDAEPDRVLLSAAFGDHYRFTAFPSAEAFLAGLGDGHPDLVLLDVGLPGMDGYALCRLLKARPSLAEVPVIFLSGHDDLESRLAGYRAGGEDFVVKPYNVEELRQKVALALAQRARHESLAWRADESQMRADTTQSYLDDCRRTLSLLRDLNRAADITAIGDQLLAHLNALRLDAAFEMRLPNARLRLSTRGASSPLTGSILRDLALGAAFGDDSRTAFNYPRVTVLVRNMPAEGSLLFAHLRDLLAATAAGVDTRLLALLAEPPLRPETPPTTAG